MTQVFNVYLFKCLAGVQCFMCSSYLDMCHKCFISNILVLGVFHECLVCFSCLALLLVV